MGNWGTRNLQSRAAPLESNFLTTDGRQRPEQGRNEYNNE
jgi:hypothetical protein